jgi:hypothetical protein
LPDLAFLTDITLKPDALNPKCKEIAEMISSVRAFRVELALFLPDIRKWINVENGIKLGFLLE